MSVRGAWLLGHVAQKLPKKKANTPKTNSDKNAKNKHLAITNYDKPSTATQAEPSTTKNKQNKPEAQQRKHKIKTLK